MLLIDFIDDFTVTNYYRRLHIKVGGGQTEVMVVGGLLPARR